MPIFNSQKTLPDVSEETITRIYDLAFFINYYEGADEEEIKEVALRVTSETLIKLDALWDSQLERFDYDSNKRTKIYLDKESVLQWLTYITSLKYETQTENSEAKLTQSDMLVRYITHLARISTNYNSFHVICAFYLFLYDYDYESLEKLADIINSGEIRFSDNFRQQKLRVKKRILKRFPVDTYLRETAESYTTDESSTQFKSKKFKSRSINPQELELFIETLKKIIPWQSDCNFIETLLKCENSLLEQSSKNSIQQGKIERNKMHVVIDPNCNSRLLKHLKLEAVKKEIRLPEFQNAIESSSEADPLYKTKTTIDQH